MLITKRDMIAAVLREPLTAGSFIDYKSSTQESSDEGCSVCAVGAVMRAAGLGVLPPPKFANMGQLLCGGAAAACSEPEPGNVLSALSVEWESMVYAEVNAYNHGRGKNEAWFSARTWARQHPQQVEALRGKLVAWVHDNVPADWSQELPDAPVP